MKSFLGHFLAPCALSVLTALTAGCGSKGGDSAAPAPPGTGARPAGTAAGSGAAFAGGFAAGGNGGAKAPGGPTSPSLAAIASGSWKDPGGGPDLKLVATKLDKCYGFKSYSMKLPENAELGALMGARSCRAKLPGAKKGFSLVVISDELKIPLPKKEEIQDVKEKTYDSPDAFLYKIERKGKVEYAGWWEKKIGKNTLRCNSIMDEGSEPYSYDFERAVIELCRTLESSAM